MHLDVQDLRNFYYRSTLGGRAAQKAVRDHVTTLWDPARARGGKPSSASALPCRFCAPPI